MLSQPSMLGDFQSPAPRAAMPIWGPEPPDPHGTGTGPGSARSPERAPAVPGCPGGRRPLPDPVAVQLYRIPDPAPPYDGQAAAGAQPTAPGGRAPADPGRAGHPARAAGPDPDVSPGWPSRFAQVLAETLAGSRPPGQMVPWTTEMARRHIKRLGPELASVQRPRVRRVVTFHPTSDVMEMTVVVGFGPRVRALAVRLERTESPAQPPWLCTAVEAA
jgi:uncharacterized protein DUF6459